MRVGASPAPIALEEAGFTGSPLGLAVIGLDVETRASQSWQGLIGRKARGVRLGDVVADCVFAIHRRPRVADWLCVHSKKDAP